MNLTEEQEAIIDQATALLTPFSKERTSYDTYYFEETDEDGDRVGDSDFSEYDICDNDGCFDKTLAELKEANPELNINYRYSSNDGDHEVFEHCYQCGRPLNDTLTWIKDELQYHIDNSTTKENLMVSSTAFEIIGCFDSIGWAQDYAGSIHANTYHPEEVQKDQEDFVNKVVEYARLIIDVLKII